MKQIVTFHEGDTVSIDLAVNNYLKKLPHNVHVVSVKIIPIYYSTEQGMFNTYFLATIITMDLSQSQQEES